MLLNQADQGQGKLPLVLLGSGLRAKPQDEMLNKVWSRKVCAVRALGRGTGGQADS